MLLQHQIPTPDPEEKYRAVQASLAQPSPSILAQYLQMRLASERETPDISNLTCQPYENLRPKLPKVSMAALMLFNNRKAVESYPLIYNTLALAHPN
jgi:hypothetical protein